jgi:uncharacterized membrane protein
MKWLPLILLLAAWVFSAADFAYYYDQLPPRMACHFDLQGNANGWMTKQQFFGFDQIIFAVLAVVLTVVTWLLRAVPSSSINVPHKEYWLAPEREAELVRPLSGGASTFSPPPCGF